MDLRRFGLLILLCLTAVGCRKDPYMDAYFELLNSEKRVLEDRLYELEYDYQKALKELEAYRAAKEKTTGSPSQPEPDRPSDGQRDTDDAGDAMELEIPEIQLPPGFESSNRLTPNRSEFRTASVAAGVPDPVEKSIDRKLSDQELADAIVAVLDQDVDHIVIDPRATSGADFDDLPGDDGLTVVIQPRNRRGHFVPTAGPLTLVLLDPAMAAQSARVAKWEIDEETARQAMETDRKQRGMSLRLPWPGDKPEHSRLNLYVRFRAPDGTTREAHQEIRVQADERVAHRWTPRSSSGPDRDESPEGRKSPEATVAWQTTEQPTNPSSTVQAIAQEEVSEPATSTPVAKQTDDDASPPMGRFWKPQR